MKTRAFMKVFLKRYQHPAGYVLLTALVFLAIIMLISTSVITYATRYVAYERATVADAQALALVEAGIDKAVYQMNQDPSYAGETNTPLDSGAFTVAVTTIDASTKRVAITGCVPDCAHPRASRTGKATISIGNDSIAFHYGVQTGTGGFSLTGGSTINGSVYSNGNITATNGVHITGSAVAANPPALTTDQANDTPVPISSCTSATCLSFGNGNSTKSFAQSFHISSATTLNSIKFYIKKVGTPSDAPVYIVNDVNGSPSTDVVLTGTLSSSAVTSNFGWATVTFPSTPVLDPGQTYWIVIDSGTNASKYYVIGANSSYASGLAKIGKYGTSWSGTTPAGLDGYFEVYLGGGTSLIGGNSYTTGVYVGSTNADTTWAHTVQGATVAGPLYCQASTATTKSCDTTHGDPPAVAMPLSDNNINEWKDEAAAGGTYNGDYTVGFAGASLGPKKINGNLIVTGGGTLNLTGTLWVTGTITVTSGGKVKLDPSFGSRDGAIVSDGYVSLTGGSSFAGSGTSGSYPFLVTTSACPVASGCNGNNAILLSGGAGTVALVAQDGTVQITGGSALKAVTAKQIVMDGGATLYYDSGLINANFYSGPGGSWKVTRGSFAITH